MQILNAIKFHSWHCFDTSNRHECWVHIDKDVSVLHTELHNNSNRVQRVNVGTRACIHETRSNWRHFSDRSPRRGTLKTGVSERYNKRRTRNSCQVRSNATTAVKRYARACRASSQKALARFNDSQAIIRHIRATRIVWRTIVGDRPRFFDDANHVDWTVTLVNPIQYWNTKVKEKGEIWNDTRQSCTKTWS